MTQLDLIPPEEKAKNDEAVPMTAITALWDLGLIPDSAYARIALAQELHSGELKPIDLNVGQFFRLSYKYQGNLESKEGTYKTLKESAWMQAAYALVDKSYLDFSKAVQCQLTLGVYGNN